MNENLGFALVAGFIFGAVFTDAFNRKVTPEVVPTAQVMISENGGPFTTLYTYTTNEEASADAHRFDHISDVTGNGNKYMVAPYTT